MQNPRKDWLYFWRHLFAPNQSLRFFPPHFWLRNPVTPILKKSYRSNRMHVVIVFDVQTYKHQIEQFGMAYVQQFEKDVRILFKKVVCDTVKDEEILFLQQYWGDDIVLLLSLPQESNVIHMIEKYIENIKVNINEHFFAYDQEDEDSFQTGYMVLEAHTDQPFHSFLNAYQKALVMAKKGVGAKYNQMVHEIRGIIQKENISLYSQPIVNVHQLDVMAWEVLTRGPEHTAYEHPLHLFSMARQTNMLYLLELLVIKKALQKMRGQDAIFINVTPQTIAHKHFINDLDEILQDHVHINPAQIVFEITESESVERYSHLSKTIEDLRKRKIRIALDDTGAGYASLNSISFLRPDIIKVDRSLIENINGNKLKESMLQGLIHIAREANAQIVAEGIETAEEAQVIKRNGVHLVQGFFYARPRLIPTPTAG
ncbi:EAL domain-containing protein [Pseudalkalibacillus salsuginis]|uniref:EAL domain-containing protein n=1 Tax=Pseudalkalibacillus salsuginis TaxID=2910972 RepID=UPI001F349AF9|nr:EAL domain-containing protein [Pseudalkalibacillus salsuginis]MCF6409065.1 EAL domain-containing protein [Pseudalkalibacillus salsuginis]